MRPGQNRRIRGRNRPKSPNPLTRSYESNGPDVKIRGTAQTVADKYAQLARDAQASGDPVSAENYFQHAEHYYRMIAAAQEQFRQQYGGTQRFDEDGEEGDEEGFGPQGQQAGNGMDEFGDGGGYPAQGFEPRGGDRPQQQQRFDRNDQPPRYDRNDGQQPRYDRNERPNNNNNRQQRFDRNDQQPRYDRNQDRPGGGERFERPAGGERQDRRDRFQQPRDGGNREFTPRDGQRDQRPEARSEGEPQRDARSEREPRQEREPRPEREARQEREPRQEPRQERQPRAERPAYRAEPRFEERGPEMESPAANLPAFLTNPVRAPAIVAEAGAGVEQDMSGETSPGGEPDAQAVRPRRRRVRKVDATETVGLDLANGTAEPSE